MEWLVGALLVLGLLAVVIRFLPRDPSGEIRLPRIVDDSIGMWVLRRLTGRPLGRSPDLPDVDPLARFRRPSTAIAARVDPRVRTVGRRGQPPRAGPRSVVSAPLEPTWSVVERPANSSRPFGASILVTPAEDGPPARASLRLRPSWVFGAVVLGLLLGGAAALVTR